MSEKWIAVPLKDRTLWSAHKPIFEDGLWAIIREDSPELLPVAVVDRGDDHDAPTRAKAERIAKLLAAAPELLEACKFVADKCNDPALVAILDAAISQAEGRNGAA